MTLCLGSASNNMWLLLAMSSIVVIFFSRGTFVLCCEGSIASITSSDLLHFPNDTSCPEVTQFTTLDNRWHTTAESNCTQACVRVYCVYMPVKVLLQGCYTSTDAVLLTLARTNPEFVCSATMPSIQSTTTVPTPTPSITTITTVMSITTPMQQQQQQQQSSAATTSFTTSYYAAAFLVVTISFWSCIC